MAMSSGIFGGNLGDSLNGTQLVLSLVTTPANWKLMLVNNAITPNYNVASSSDDSGYNASGMWVTNEVVGTANWSAGGHTLSTIYNTGDCVPTLTYATGYLTYDHTNDPSVASVTASGIYGCMIYADNLTKKNGIVGVLFGGSPPYSPNAGTFGINWNASGIFRISYV